MHSCFLPSPRILHDNSNKQHFKITTMSLSSYLIDNITIFFFQRYNPNFFEKNNIILKDEQDYLYYVRPYITFWCDQNLTFEKINGLSKVPSQREGEYSRYILEKLGRTWILDDPEDKNWFDEKTVYEELEKDLIMKLQSKFPPTSSKRKIHFVFFWTRIKHFTSKNCRNTEQFKNLANFSNIQRIQRIKTN